MNNPTDSLLPLAPAALHILLALASGELHGYGIMQTVAEQSGGGHKLGPGTLYDNLQRLMERGLIEEDEAVGRRRNYRLTRLGLRVLSAEVARLEGLIRSAKVHLEEHFGRM